MSNRDDDIDLSNPVERLTCMYVVLMSSGNVELLEQETDEQCMNRTRVARRLAQTHYALYRWEQEQMRREDGV